MVMTRSKAAAEGRTKADDSGNSQVKLPEAEGDLTGKPGEDEHEPSEEFPEFCLVTDGEELELAVPIAEMLKVNTEEFSAAQKEDESVNTLFEKYQDVKAESERDTYFVRNSLLYKKRKSKKGDIYEMLVVPGKFRGPILRICHEVVSAHLGIAKSKNNLSKHFFWPNCFKEMEQFVRSCDSCQRVGHSGDRKKAPLVLVPTIREVFSRLNLDTIGPFQRSSTGNVHVLTAICVASRYPEAIPIPDLQTPTVIDALLQLFSRTGFPREIQTDQGPCFRSTLMAEFANKFGIKLIHSSVYHPQTNPVERVHSTINRLFKVLCLEAGTDWEKQIPAILFALRTSFHESFGFSPAELVFGRNLRTPITLLYENLSGIEPESSEVTEYIFRLANRLKVIRDAAHEKLSALQVKRKTWYDKKAVIRTFNVGDKVLVFAPNKVRKLSVQWIGPGEIVEKVSDTNYVIQMPNKSTGKVYHVNMIKAYVQRTEYVNFIVDQGIGEFMEDGIEKYALKLEPEEFDVEAMLAGTEMEPEGSERLRELVIEFRDIFSDRPGLTKNVQMDIELLDENARVRSAPYRTSHRQTKILQEEIAKMLRDGIIEPSDSDFTSPMILVEAPGKKPRPCIDYRKLNQVIRTEYFPLPSLAERIETVARAKIITTTDLCKGFWQIQMSERAQRYATFTTKFGSYKPLRMPFGIKNAPYVCSKLMEALLKDCAEFAVPYMDDIAIFSDNWDDHCKHLRIVFQKLREANLRVQPAKCKFARKSVTFLGYEIGSGLMRPNEAKVQVIKEYPRPTTKKEIRKFIGLISYYKRFIRNFSEKSAALTDLLRGTHRQGKIRWSEECENSFIQLRDALCQGAVTHAPDFSKPFLLQCDAALRGAAIVLSQLDQEGNENPILFLSKKFSDGELKWSTTEKECAALIWGLGKLRYYLDGNVLLKIETDHNPLVWLQQNAGNNPRLLRWSLAIQHYNIIISHRKGTLNVNADILSRVFENERQTVSEVAEGHTAPGNADTCAPKTLEHSAKQIVQEE